MIGGGVSGFVYTSLRLNALVFHQEIIFIVLPDKCRLEIGCLESDGELLGLEGRPMDKFHLS